MRPRSLVPILLVLTVFAVPPALAAEHGIDVDWAPDARRTSAGALWLEPGRTMQVPVTVTNGLDEPLTNVTLRLYSQEPEILLVLDEAVPGGGRHETQATWDAVAANATVERTVSVVLPPNARDAVEIIAEVTHDDGNATATLEAFVVTTKTEATGWQRFLPAIGYGLSVLLVGGLFAAVAWRARRLQPPN